MKRIVVYLATSIDGAIARGDGRIDWLDDAGDFGFAAFLDGIDAIVMGRVTYDEILDFETWPYGKRETWVVSRKREGRDRHASFGADLGEILERLRSASGSGRVWIAGGGAVVAEALRLDLVDDLELFVHPVILGDGIPMVPFGVPDRPLELVAAEPQPRGLVRLVYRRVR